MSIQTMRMHVERMQMLVQPSVHMQELQRAEEAASNRAKEHRAIAELFQEKMAQFTRAHAGLVERYLERLQGSGRAEALSLWQDVDDLSRFQEENKGHKGDQGYLKTMHDHMRIYDAAVKEMVPLIEDQQFRTRFLKKMDDEETSYRDYMELMQGEMERCLTKMQVTLTPQGGCPEYEEFFQPEIARFTAVHAKLAYRHFRGENLEEAVIDGESDLERIVGRNQDLRAFLQEELQQFAHFHEAQLREYHKKLQKVGAKGAEVPRISHEKYQEAIKEAMRMHFVRLHRKMAPYAQDLALMELFWQEIAKVRTVHREFSAAYAERLARSGPEEAWALWARVEIEQISYKGYQEALEHQMHIHENAAEAAVAPTFAKCMQVVEAQLATVMDGRGVALETMEYLLEFTPPSESDRAALEAMNDAIQREKKQVAALAERVQHLQETLRDREIAAAANHDANAIIFEAARLADYRIGKAAAIRDGVSQYVDDLIRGVLAHPLP